MQALAKNIQTRVVEHLAKVRLRPKSSSLNNGLVSSGPQAFGRLKQRLAQVHVELTRVAVSKHPLSNPYVRKTEEE